MSIYVYYTITAEINAKLESEKSPSTLTISKDFRVAVPFAYTRAGLRTK